MQFLEKNKRTIIFRADGSSTIGMGHFIRTLALAEMLKEHFYCIYATQKPTKYQIDEIERVCNDHFDLPEDDSHFDMFLNYLKGNEIVVLDNYFFTTEYQLKIKEKGCKLVCIDDIHDKHFVSDIVINHAEGINPDVYSKNSDTELLLGYNYALLRKEFLKSNNNSLNKIYSSLVIIGGADPLNVTKKIVNIIDKHPSINKIAVVVGYTYKDNNELQGNSKVELFKGIDAAQLSHLMHVSTFGILPASTVAIEACATRLPFICGYFVENQKDIYTGIEISNLAVCVDNLFYITEQKLSDAIKKITSPNIIKDIIINQIEKLDKQSHKRLIQIFLKL